MKNILTIAMKDFRSNFSSPIAWIVIAAFLGIIGWMFFWTLEHFGAASMRFQQTGQKGISLADGVIRPLFGNMNVILLFILPFVTMRLFAEEKKSQTIVLLFTSPVTIYEIILGKFFSVFLLLCVMLSVTLVYPITLFLTGNPEFGPILTAYVGTILLASCYLSVGMLFSATSEKPDCRRGTHLRYSLVFLAHLLGIPSGWAGSGRSPRIFVAHCTLSRF